MRATFAFTSADVVSELKSKTAFEAIDELVEQLARANRVLPRDKHHVSVAIKSREQSMSTGIGFGIAIPHAYTERISEIVAVFGRSSRGIEFSALDGQPVKFVTLIITPADRRQAYLWMLNWIARLLHQRNIRSELETALDAHELVQILNGASSRVK